MDCIASALALAQALLQEGPSHQGDSLDLALYFLKTIDPRRCRAWAG